MSFETTVLLARDSLIKGDDIPFYLDGEVTYFDSGLPHLKQFAWDEIRKAERWIMSAEQGVTSGRW